MTDFYKTLGIRRDATSDEIKQAYRKLVKKYHPDVCKGDKAVALEKIKRINEAYETLSDLQKRRVYDVGQQAKPTISQPKTNPNIYSPQPTDAFVFIQSARESGLFDELFPRKKHK